MVVETSRIHAAFRYMNYLVEEHERYKTEKNEAVAEACIFAADCVYSAIKILTGFDGDTMEVLKEAAVTKVNTEYAETIGAELTK